MAGKTYGRLALTINGVTLPVQTCKASNSGGASYEAKANADGSIYRIETPQPVIYEVEFEANAWRWTPAYLNASVDMTLVEASNGRRHVATDGDWVGEPSVDLNTGAVTGLRLAFPAKNVRVT